MDRSAIQGKESIMAQDTMTPSEVRPFQVDVPEEDLVDLRRRIAATKWPEKEPVDDLSQGVPLATMQERRYWAEEYDLLSHPTFQRRSRPAARRHPVYPTRKEPGTRS
jgi:hypothetical protein